SDLCFQREDAGRDSPDCRSAPQSPPSPCDNPPPAQAFTACRNPCLGGVIGSRDGLKIRSRKGCRFESDPRHQPGGNAAKNRRATCPGSRGSVVDKSLKIRPEWRDTTRPAFSMTSPTERDAAAALYEIYQ